MGLESRVEVVLELIVVVPVVTGVAVELALGGPGPFRILARGSPEASDSFGKTNNGIYAGRSSVRFLGACSF